MQSVARITEISARSDISFEDAINVGIARATKSLRGVKGAWVKEQEALIDDGKVVGYEVKLKITFELED
jgi:dodecin